MEFQQGKRGGPVVALITLKTPLLETLVGFHMSFKVALDSKGFITEVAVVGFLFCMTTLVLQNVSLKSESLWTEFALVLFLHPRLLGGVTGAHVGSEVTSGLELLGTNVTLVPSDAGV